MDLEPAPAPLTPIDHAILLAARVWGSIDVDDLWNGFPSARQTSLRWAWNEGGAAEEPDALERLRIQQAAQTRPDLARVHASWWVRALKDEPTSIQRSVVANLPPALAEVLRNDLGFTEESMAPASESVSNVARVALALWTVRLVGDVLEVKDEPPVLAALTRLDGAAISRLLQAVGLAKWSISDGDAPALSPRDRTRFDHFRATFAAPDPRFLPVVKQDVESLDSNDAHAVTRLGMIGIARLLNAADPYRVRWALQHIPYGTSQVFRSLMGPLGRRSPMLVRWETATLHAAWLLLQREGWINEPWGALP